MSTIHDALKKVEKNMHPQHTGSPSPSPEIKPKNPFAPSPQKSYEKPPVPTEQSPKPSSPKPISASSIFLLLVIIGAIIWRTPAAVETLKSHHVTLPKFHLPFFKTKKTVPLQPGDSSTAMVNRTSSPLLQGIMSVNNQPVALINNTIYEKGDFFNKKKITEISKNTVTLIDDNGETTILRIPK